MRIIAQHYPNNEIRVVICPDRPVGKAPAECGSEGGEGGDSGGQGAGALPLTLGPNSEPHSAGKPGFGGVPRPTAFGVNARRALMRAGGALQKHGIANQELVFLTGTLPGSSRQSMLALQRYSSYAVDLLKSKVSKLGCTQALSLYCWELQQRGALHIHYCVHVPDEDKRRMLCERWTGMWCQIIDAIGRKAGIDMWEKQDGTTWKDHKDVLQAPAQIVTKGVGQYLAKYLSKGSNSCGGSNCAEGVFLGPVRWWGVSRPLLKLVEAYSDRVEVECINGGEARRTREDLLSILSGMDAKIVTYSDKAKTSEVFVSYSPENSSYVYSEIVRRIGFSSWLRHDFTNDKGRGVA